MGGLFPFVRIGLYALAGYLAGQGADSWVVDYIRTDPDLAAAVVGVVAGIWYAAARHWGWAK